jgi:pantoate--beta-alanine ligase
VREQTGLAMSSRNGYLSEKERASASQLNSALQGIVEAIKNGNYDFNQLEKEACQQLTKNGWAVDYISVRAATTLSPETESNQQLVVLGAATLGKTRLIDNIEI